MQKGYVVFFPVGFNSLIKLSNYIPKKYFSAKPIESRKFSINNNKFSYDCYPEIYVHKNNIEIVNSCFISQNNDNLCVPSINEIIKNAGESIKTSFIPNAFTLNSSTLLNKWKVIKSEILNSMRNNTFSHISATHCETTQIIAGVKSESKENELNLIFPPDTHVHYLRTKSLKWWQTLYGFVCQIIGLVCWGSGVIIPFYFLYTLFNLRNKMIECLISGALLLIPHVLSKLNLLTNKSFIGKLLGFPFGSGHYWMPKGTGIILEDKNIIEDLKNPNNKPSMICFHPHGIVSVGVGMCSQLGIYKNLILAEAPLLYYIQPLMRLITEPNVKVASVNADSLKKIMIESKKKKHLAIVPGGFNEASIMKCNVERLYIKNRKGFVKYALRGGYTLTPVYMFGESDTYNNVQGMWNFRMLLNSAHIPAVLFSGYPLMPVIPKRVPILVVVGKPIEIPKIDNPTNEEVAKYHAIYVNALQELYLKYRSVYFGQIRGFPQEEVEKKNLVLW